MTTAQFTDDDGDGAVMDSRHAGDIDWFLTQSTQDRLWINQPDFDRFYVRKTFPPGPGSYRMTWKPTNDSPARPTIELANISARLPGAGAFKRLIAHLLMRYEGRYIVAECVLTTQFAEGLLRMGFLPVTSDESGSRSYFLPT